MTVVLDIWSQFDQKLKRAENWLLIGIVIKFHHCDFDASLKFPDPRFAR